MPPRLFVPSPLSAGAELSLPASAARHVQVLRLQPGAALTLFDGNGGEWGSEVRTMGRRDVVVGVGAHRAVEREITQRVTLALGVPANERMDSLIEKATELGVSAIQPLMCERSVLRLDSERAQRRCAHWSAVAAAACEQSGRNRLPQVHAPMTLAAWLNSLGATGHDERIVLSLQDAAPWSSQASKLSGAAGLIVLSGPEGGLSEREEALARAQGFLGVRLGERVLRADTAPLAVLASLSLAAP